MNAIALLSGWSHQRENRGPSSAPSSRRSSVSRHGNDDEEQQKQKHAGEALALQQEISSDAELLHRHLDSLTAAESRPEPEGSSRSTSSPQIDELARIVKPPESTAYEELEEAAQRIPGASSDNTTLLDPAAIYPTPPASRLPTPTDAIDEAARRENGEGLNASNENGNGLSSSITPSASLKTLPESRFQGKLFRRQSPAQSHDEVRTAQQQRRLSDRHTRALARSFPVRCIARIYMLLRRFFALFGIQLQPASTAITNAPEAIPSLTTPILAIPPPRVSEDAPPSYEDATQTVNPGQVKEQAGPPQRSSRWKIGSLLNRNKAAGSPLEKDTTSNTTEDYASTSSDEWGPSEEKKVLHKAEHHARSNTSMPIPVTRVPYTHAKPKTSVAQVALSKPKLLVLDLDETLIHSTSRMSYASSAVTSSVDSRSTWNANTSGLKVRVVEVVLDGRSVIYHVYKRPWVDFFLRKVSSWYTVVIFTASLQEYADPVIDWLDQGSGMISSRLFRESCTFVNGSYVKDLSIVDKDLARVCLVDNSPISYAVNPGELARSTQRRTLF